MPLVLAVLAAYQADASPIVAWDLTGDNGSQATEPAATVASNITGLDITRGDGLIAIGGNGGQAFTSTGWQGTDLDDFISFGFTVDPGFLVDLTQLSFATRSQNNGPGTLGLFSSLDGFTAPLETLAQASNTAVNHTVDLSSLSRLTGQVEFRLIEIGNTQADGTGTTENGRLSIRNFNSSPQTPFAIEGVVAAIPEPSSLLLCGLLTSVALKRRRSHVLPSLRRIKA